MGSLILCQARNVQRRWQSARSGLSLAQLTTAKLDAKCAAGRTLDKIASLQKLVKAFA
jgi:hypothetical protein